MEEKISFKPLGARVLVRLPEIKEETNAGIFKGKKAIDAEKKKAAEKEELIVAAIGEEVTKVNIGDNILVNNSGPLMAIELPEGNFAIVQENMILGIKL